MTETELKARVVRHNKKRLDRLIDLLGGIEPKRHSIDSIELVVADRSGKSHSVKFDGDALDTYLVFSSLLDSARTRSSYLGEKLDEIEKELWR